MKLDEEECRVWNEKFMEAINTVSAKRDAKMDWLEKLNQKYLQIQGSSKIMVTRADGPYLSIDEDIDTNPFFLWLGKEFLRDFRSALLFLWEHPEQLKYIEWPSFQSTLKTTTLTLLLVMLLIIFLSSIDSALSYFLVSTLRRNS